MPLIARSADVPHASCAHGTITRISKIVSSSLICTVSGLPMIKTTGGRDHVGRSVTERLTKRTCLQVNVHSTSCFGGTRSTIAPVVANNGCRLVSTECNGCTTRPNSCCRSVFH